MAPRFARNHNDEDGCRARVDSQATRQLQARHGTRAMPFSNDDVGRPCDRDLVRQDVVAALIRRYPDARNATRARTPLSRRPSC